MIVNSSKCELNKISEWLKLNKLLQIKFKFYTRYFINPQKYIASISLNIKDTVIAKVKDFNFLGLMVNEHLNWKTDTDKVSNSISKTIATLNRLKHFLLIKIKLTLYNSLIISHINYCLPIWGMKMKESLNYKKAIRIINISLYNAHNEPIFKKLKLHKGDDILNLQISLNVISNVKPKCYPGILVIKMGTTIVIVNVI